MSVLWVSAWVTREWALCKKDMHYILSICQWWTSKKRKIADSETGLGLKVCLWQHPTGWLHGCLSVEQVDWHFYDTQAARKYTWTTACVSPALCIHVNCCYGVTLLFGWEESIGKAKTGIHATLNIQFQYVLLDIYHNYSMWYLCRHLNSSMDIPTHGKIQTIYIFLQLLTIAYWNISQRKLLFLYSSYLIL